MNTNKRNSMRAAILIAVPALLLATQAIAQNPDRSKPPELGPPPSLSLPSIQKTTLSNGIPVVVMEKHEIPIVQLNLMVRAGSTIESQSKIGLASLTAAMLKEGAGDKSSLELADAIEYLGASINVSPSYHATWVSLHTPLSKFGQAFDLFADIVLRPTFPTTELERLRKERLTALVQMYDQPTMVASVATSKLVFGEKHPYGRRAMGTEKTLRGFTIDDVKEYYGKYFHAGNAAFIVVGDVKMAEVVAKLEKAFGEWRKGEPTVANVDVPDQVNSRIICLIDKPEAPQSVVRISRVGVDRTTKDFFPLVVMNTILGGSFSSRLNMNLREKHGYTYGASSSFDMRLAPGPFVAGASIQTAVTDKAITEFMNELNGILVPVSDQELTRAKNYLALGYPGNFESVMEVAGQLGEMLFYNLPDDYFNNYIKNVLSVTKDDVQRVAKKYLDPMNIVIVIVGDQKKVELSLKDLNLGKIKVMKIEDVLGTMPVL